MLEALESDELTGVALDVFIKEPPDPASAIINHPKVIATPHLGASTIDAQKTISSILSNEIIKFFKK